VAQIDPTDERHVAPGPVRMTNDEQLLVVAAVTAHTLVEEDFAASVIDGLHEVQVLLFAEVVLVRMRPPDQPTHVNVALRQGSQHTCHLRAWTLQALVGIPRQSVKRTRQPGSRSRNTACSRR
jgi:hypothetical protein